MTDEVVCDDVETLTWCSVTDDVVCDDVETLTWCSVTDDVVCDDVETNVSTSSHTTSSVTV